MQAGFGFEPIIVRREGTQTEARSAVGEFVSGNYFRTFGLQAGGGTFAGGRGRSPGRSDSGGHEL